MVKNKMSSYTCSGKTIFVQTEIDRLNQLFYNNHRTRENIYRDVILAGQPWFEKGNPNSYRTQLIKQGLSQREATSIYKSVLSQLSANRENLKAYRKKQTLKLVRAIKELVQAKAEIPRNKGKVRSKNEWLQRLNANLKRIDGELKQDYPNLYFTGKDTKLALQYTEQYGYKSHDEARQAFQKERDNGYFLEGDREACYGNYSAKILLDPTESKGGTLLLKTPYGQDIKLECKGFSGKQGRFEVLAAQERYGIQQGGELEQKRNICRAAVSVRVYWSKKYRAYYVQASVPRDPWIIQRAQQLRLEQQALNNQQKVYNALQPGIENGLKIIETASGYALGVDLNPSHIAYCLVKRDGNPLPKHSGRFDLKASGSKGQRKACLGNSIKQLLQLHQNLEAEYGPIVLVTERLNFKQGKQTGTAAVNSTLNSFAYSQFKNILQHRLLENDIKHAEIDPAYTSKIGQLNYASPYGLSVDISAAVVIARRGLNLDHRLRPVVRAGFAALASKTIKTSPKKGKAKHVNKYTQICSHLGGRNLTWSSGLLNRVQVLKPPNL